LVAGVAAQVALVLVGTGQAGSQETQWLPGQSFVDGERVFTEKGCGQCHSVLGTEKGGMGPDLRAGGGWGDVMQLAGSLWNHAPVMARMSREQGIERSALSVDEMGKLAAYVFQLNFVDQPGDVDRGRVLFEQRSCARCHQLGGRGGTVGPRLDELKPYATSIFLAQALWNHGPRMATKMTELGVERPALQGDDLDHLLAFMRGEAASSTSLDRIAAQSGSPRAGKTVFARKGCLRCHAIGGTGGDVGPDLGIRRPQWRLAEMVAALWNHGPAMWSKMQALEIPVPQLADREMADLLAYLFFIQFANADGDAAKGAAIFRDKSCAVCHAAASGTASPGPALAQFVGTRSPLDWASAMWNHAPTAMEKLRERGSSWPRFEDDEMRDLAAFLRAPGGEG